MYGVRRSVPFAILVAALLGGCATSPAPRGWLPTVREAPADVYGGWIELRADRGAILSRGELIAVSGGVVYVLETTGLKEVPAASVREATVSVYQPETAPVAQWGTLGALSSLSHGVFLFGSIPAWLVVSGIAQRELWAEARVEFPPASWSDVARYARFPAGPPPGFDPHSLVPRH